LAVSKVLTADGLALLAQGIAAPADGDPHGPFGGATVTLSDAIGALGLKLD
jgi:hypothetical protein